MKKAGNPKKTEPRLHLRVVEIDQLRKRIEVTTGEGTKLMLCYDGKQEWFHLHCFTPLGKLGGKVYNDWVLEDDIRKLTEHW